MSDLEVRDEDELVENGAEDFCIPESKISDNESKNWPFDINATIAEIDAKIAEFKCKENESKKNEENIIQMIKDSLKENELKYIYDEDIPNLIEMECEMHNKSFCIQIFVQNSKVIFRLVFPFKVHCNSLALVTMYMAEVNKNKAFAFLNLDLNDGEVAMTYSYLLENAKEYNDKYFRSYMKALIYPALENYNRLYYLAIGKVSREIKEYYKILLERSLAVINGEEDEEEIIYGSEDLRKEKKIKKVRRKSKNSMPENNNKGEEVQLDTFEQSGERSSIASFEEHMMMLASHNLYSLQEMLMKDNDEEKTTTFSMLFEELRKSQDNEIEE